MRLLTYNIWNYQRPWPDRRAIIADLIRAHNPDVVALQETRHDFRYERGRGQGEQLADLTGYQSTFALGQVYLPLPRVDEGLTVLTREPPLDVFVRELEQFRHERSDDNRRVVLGIRIRLGGQEVDVYNAHFSLSPVARVHNAVETFQFVMERSGDGPAYLMGDLNALPDTTPIGFLTGREQVDDVTGDFLDCWTAMHPQDPGFTYSSWDPDHRVDYVLARNLAGNIHAVQRIGLEPREGMYPSDHVGILVDVG